MKTFVRWLLIPIMPVVRWAHHSTTAEIGFGHCPVNGLVSFSITDSRDGRRLVLLSPAAAREWSEQFAYMAEKAELAASLRDDG